MYPTRTQILTAIAFFTLTSASTAIATGTMPQTSVRTVDITDIELFGACQGSSTVLATNSLPEGKSDFFQANFDDMILTGSNTKSKRRGYKDCFVEMAVELPQGYTIGELNIEYDGFMELSAKSLGRVGIHVTIPGITNRRWNNSQYHQTQKYGPFSDDYSAKFTSSWGDLPSQTCRSKVNVYVDVLMDLKVDRKAAAEDEHQVTVDIVSGLFDAANYKMSVVPCKRYHKPWWAWWIF